MQAVQGVWVTGIGTGRCALACVYFGSGAVSVLVQVCSRLLRVCVRDQCKGRVLSFLACTRRPTKQYR
jgi:hypothetical protein